jgi:hypothetical protein
VKASAVSFFVENPLYTKPQMAEKSYRNFQK